MTKRRKITIVCIAALMLLIGWGMYALWQTKLAIAAVKQFELNIAVTHARRAQLFPKVMNEATLGLISDLVIWDDGLSLIQTVSQFTNDSFTYGQTLFSSDEADKKLANSHKNSIVTDMNMMADLTQKIETRLPKSLIAQKIISSQQRAQLNQLNQAVQTIPSLLSGKHTYLLLFQNSQELRATGGFLGSYARLTLNDGGLDAFSVEDIYVPDGQFKGFVPAPAGVSEYLSGGNGLRLPDANWSPDFPTSAQTILSYFAAGNQTDIEGVIAINLTLAEELLKVTGPISVPDYDATVTADNFAQIARADRDDFFPGSQQKKHFLSVFFNRLIAELQNLDSQQQTAVADILMNNAIQKEIQFFSYNTQLQTLFEQTKLSGQIYTNSANAYLFLVESNVGINKANRNVDRGVTVDVSDATTTLTVAFTNHNLESASREPTEDKSAGADHLGYVNYQRLLVKPDVKITAINWDDQPIETWDEEIITTHNGDQLKQIGFLIALPEQTSKKLTITLSHPSLTNQLATSQPTIVMQKQSGLRSIPYTIFYKGKTQSFDLIKDTAIQLR